MIPQDFKGEARPLDRIDVPKLAHRIAVSEDHFQAFLNVESRSRGFDRRGRPVILCEPHVFYRNLSGQNRIEAVEQGLAYPNWGEKPYPRSQDERYIWLNKARKIEPEAAMKACSWGASQILGENFSLVGYTSIESMVRAFMDDEEEHIEAMMKYILATGIADDLRNERWEVVARVYNGPGYKKNGYHTKMAREFAQLRKQPDVGWQPDRPDPSSITIHDRETILSVQKRLRDLGYFEVGKTDGIYGTKLRAGVLAFRADHGLPIVADIDDQLLAALMVAQGRPVSERRAETTVEDVRASGSRQIDAGDKQQVGGGLLAGSGIVAALGKALGLDEGGTVTQAWDAISPVVGLIETYGFYMLIGIGGYIIYQAHLAKQARVEDEREAKHVGRG